MNKYILALLFVLVGCEGGAQPGYLPIPPSKDCTAIVTWETPIERTDGTELKIEDISKFTLYVNRRNDVDDTTLILTMDITDPNLITWQFENLVPGPNYFYMTVTDKEGNTSTYSNIKGKIC